MGGTMSGNGQGISRRTVLAGTVLGATALSAAPARALAVAGRGSRAAGVVRTRTASGHTLLARPLANPDGSNRLIQIRDVNRLGHVLGMIDAGESAAQRYPTAVWANGRVTVLPPPVADASDCGANFLNDADQAAGYVIVGGRTHAVLWTGGVPRVLDIGTVYSEATALNNLGQVTVRGYNQPSGDSATWNTVCLVDGAAVTTIAPLPGMNSNVEYTATAVNNRGEVLLLGSVPQGGPRYGFLWRNGTVVADFTHVGGSPASNTFQDFGGLNPQGQVVGTFLSPSGPPLTRVFFWSGGTLTTFTGPDNGTASVSGLSRPLNDRGDVTGFSNTDTTQHPFLWSGGQAVDLGALDGGYTEAAGLNNVRQVAGTSTSTDRSSSSAFLWRAGEMIRITPPPGYATTAASWITEQGDVLGWATTADRSRSDYFRWTVL